MATSRRVGNYSTSAKAVIRASDQIFDAAMSGKPDFTKISKEAIKGRSMERRAVTEAEGKVASAGLEAFTRVNAAQMRADTDKKVESIKRPARRMAGILGGLGTLAVTGSMYVQNKRDRAEEAKEKAASDARFEQTQRELLEAMRNMNSGGDSEEIKPFEADPMPTLSGGNVSSNSNSNSSPDSGSNTSHSLTGNAKILADAIAGPESGDWGYEAFNQGGTDKGRKVVGKSGSHKNVFGTSLTDMTLSEIFHRQNTKSRGLSFQEHLDSGGLHAVGRYQFIGDTLQDEVRRMGLDPKTTKFTPEVQDKIFFSHLKRVGNISPWVGPMTKYSPEKRNYLNGLISTL